MVFKTRFAPSPTGEMHFGNVRTALFNFLAAIANNGNFLLRVEDTDIERSTEDFAVLLYKDLKWLGLTWQEGPDIDINSKDITIGNNGPYKQSERIEIYKQYYQQLLTDDKAYYCFCSEEQLALSRKLQRSQHLPPRYTGTCAHLSKQEVAERMAKGEKPTIRFRVPKGENIEFTDLVKGPQSFKSDDIGDFIIIRNDGTSSFMFCNAIDDALMGVTLALRGEDHLTNTPRQLIILKTLGLTQPQYGHISLILGSDGSPLSKRNGSKSIKTLREQGYLPQAIVNYLARLGHQYENLKFSDLKTLGEKISFATFSKSPAHYDEQHLHYWQKEAVLNISSEEFKAWLEHSNLNSLQSCPIDNPDFMKLMQENIVFPQEAARWAEILFTNNTEYTTEQLDLFKTTGKDFFKTASQYTAEAIANNNFDIKTLADLLKTKFNLSGKKLFMPLRLSLSMTDHGPELANLVALMGIKKVKERFDQVINLI